MADPLSLLASVSTITANFLRIGPMLWHFVEHTRDAPISASQIVAEIFSVDKTLENLKDHLLHGPGVNVASRSMLSFTLSACSATYLELERLVGRCVSGGRVQRLKWVFYEEDVGVVLGRLQAHKLSLMAVVQIVQCESMQEVKDSLQMLSDRIDAHFADMKRSVDTMTTDYAALKPPDTLSWSAGHTFEAELQGSRVYRNLGSRDSTYTYSSDARASLARSALSNISLGNVSIVAVTYLRLWCADLSNAEHYRFGHHDPALESRLMELAELEPPVCVPVCSRIDVEQGDVALDEDSASQYSRDDVDYALADDDLGDGKERAYVVDFGGRCSVADTLEAFVADSWYGHIKRDDSPKDHAERMDTVYTQEIPEDPLSDSSLDQQPKYEEGYLQDDLEELGREERENSEFIEEHIRIEVPGSPVLDSTDTVNALENLQATTQFDATPSTNTEVISGCWSTPTGISSVLGIIKEEPEEHCTKNIQVVDKLTQNIESSLAYPSKQHDISDDSQSINDAAHTAHQVSDQHVRTIANTESMGLAHIPWLEWEEQCRQTTGSKRTENLHLARCSADHSPQYDADTETAQQIKFRSNKKRREKKDKRKRRVREKAGEDYGDADYKIPAECAIASLTTDGEAKLYHVEEVITGRRDGGNQTENIDICVSDGCVDDTKHANMITTDIVSTPDSATEVTLDGSPGPEDAPERYPEDQIPEIETFLEEEVTKTPADDWDRWCKDFFKKHDTPEEAMDNLLEDLSDQPGEMRKDTSEDVFESPLEVIVREASDKGRREIDMATEEVTTQSIKDCNDGSQSSLEEVDAQNVVVNTLDDVPEHEPEDASNPINLSIAHFSDENVATDQRKIFLEKPTSNPSDTNDAPSPASPKSAYPPNNRDSGYMSLSETNAETEHSLRLSRNSGVATHFDDPQPRRSLDFILSYRLTRAEYFLYVSFALLLPCVVYDLCWATTVMDES